MDKKVIVNDLMQKGFVYHLTEPIGKNFDPDFKPELTPKEMLELGVFGGKYMTDCKDEFPLEWYKNAKLCHEKHDSNLNFFKVNASQPLSVWRKKGWIKTHAYGNTSHTILYELPNEEFYAKIEEPKSYR